MNLPDDLVRESDTKILYYILDGLGGTTDPDRRTTGLQAAVTPVFDELARRSETGLLVSVLPGITPGSGPGHFSLFGYDPIENNVGRGVLEAAGIDFPLQDGDIAVRINFATVDPDGNIIDRRAGRISTEECRRLCEIVSSTIDLGGVKVFIRPVKEHRAVIVLRSEDHELHDGIADTDPQATGVKPLRPVALNQEGIEVANLLAELLKQAREPLAAAGDPAYFPLLRGIARHRAYRGMLERYGLRCLAVATYPMYKGISRLLGMDVHEGANDPDDQLEAVSAAWDSFDFFFVHFKAPDARGEDGDFDARVAAIEEADAALPGFIDLKPDVVVITGDHSTPSIMKSHSWHSVPLILSSPAARHSGIEHFNELACARQGTLGTFPAKQLMGLVLGHAGRLHKFGA